MTPSRSAADLWKHTLSRIQTLFGRLEYVASLRNSHSGRYEHFGLEQRFGRDEAQRALLTCHSDIFAEWLTYTLDQQKKQVDYYLELREESNEEIVVNWLRVKPFGTWVPPSTRAVERALFLADLDAVLELIRRELGVAAPDPDA